MKIKVLVYRETLWKTLRVFMNYLRESVEPIYTSNDATLPREKDDLN